MLFRYEHPAKAPLPIEVTLFGIVMLVVRPQFLKASEPIEVKPFGSVMLVRPEQPLKA